MNPLTYCAECAGKAKSYVRTLTDRCRRWCSGRLRAVLAPEIEPVFQAQVIALKKEVVMDLQWILIMLIGAVLGYYAVCNFLTTGSVV